MRREVSCGPPTWTKRYFVGAEGGQWKVSLEGLEIGTYLTQWEAKSVAISLAYWDGQKEHHAQVLVEGTDGKFVIEWTYNHQRYRPGV